MKPLNIIILIVLIFTMKVFSQLPVGNKWEATNGPFGGKVQVVKEVGGRLFAGTFLHGLFVSDDNGLNWERPESGFPEDVTVWSLYGEEPSLVLPLPFSDSIFAGTSEGMYLSLDNGDNWSKLTDHFDKRHITSIIQIGTLLFAGTDGMTIQRSDDGGLSWGPTASCPVVYELVVKDSVIFAGTNGDGLSMSRDSGKTWEDCNITPGSYDVKAIATNDNDVYVAIHPDIYISSDNGESWTKQTEQDVSMVGITDLIAVDDTLYATTDGEGILKSTDKGKTWSSLNFGLPTEGILSIDVTDHGLFAGSTYDGVIKSVNKGISWEYCNNGLKAYDFYSIAIAGNNLIAGTFGGRIFHSADKGNTWTLVNKTSSMIFGADYIWDLLSVDSMVFAAVEGVGVLRSTDNGQTWNKFSNNLSSSCYSLAIDGQRLLAGGDHEVFQTTITENDWFKHHSWTTNAYYKALVKHKDALFSGSLTLGLFRLSDTSTVAEKIGADLSTDNIAALGSAGDILYVGTVLEGAYRSLDNGDTWEVCDFGINGALNVYGFHNIGDATFAATSAGIFHTVDSGSSWISTGEDPIISQHWALTNDETTIYTATSSGIYKCALPQGVSKSFHLPSSNVSVCNLNISSKSFSFKCNKISLLSFDLYNALGKKILSIPTSFYESGVHNININGKAIASGVYYLEVDSKASNKIIPFLIN